MFKAAHREFFNGGARDSGGQSMWLQWTFSSPSFISPLLGKVHELL